MDGIGRDFPPGDLRVSDADRDRALSELGEAFRVGRITADEFDQRSGHALRARTGKQLTALLADLPLARPSAAAIAVPQPADHPAAARCVMGASAFGAALLLARALPIALTPGHYWADSVGPEAVALLLVALIVFLHVIRADRRRP